MGFGFRMDRPLREVAPRWLRKLPRDRQREHAGGRKKVGDGQRIYVRVHIRPDVCVHTAYVYTTRGERGGTAHLER